MLATPCCQGQEAWKRLLWVLEERAFAGGRMGFRQAISFLWQQGFQVQQWWDTYLQQTCTSQDEVPLGTCLMKSCLYTSSSTEAITSSSSAVPASHNTATVQMCLQI